MQYSEHETEVEVVPGKSSTETVFHERAKLLSETGYQGFIVKYSQIVPFGYRIIVENMNGHLLQADGEHPVEILERLVDMIDAYQD